MWRGADEAKVDQTTEMYVLLSDPFIWESSNTWEIVTAEYYICRIQMFELSYKGVILRCKMIHQNIAGFQCHAIQNRSKSKSKPFNR